MRRPSVWCAAALLVAGLFVSVAGAPPAAACSCAPMSDRRMATTADAVFVGSVSDIDFGDGIVEYTFDVRRTWSDDVSTTVVVRSIDQESACGLPSLSFAEQRLVIATADDDGAFTTGLCSGGGPASDRAVATVESVLGEGTVPRAAPAPVDQEDGGWGPVPVVVSAAVLLALAGAAAAVVWRRRRAVR